MRLDNPDYIKLVKAEYQRKRMNNELPRFEVQSTRSILKEESIEVFRNRYDIKDRQTLENFFGEAEGDAQLSRLINRADTEQFRTLDNFLKGKTEKTENSNIEILAWLVDFKHRPWSLGMDVLLTEEERLMLTESIGDPGKKKPVIKIIGPELIDVEEEKEKARVNIEEKDNTKNEGTGTEFEKNKPNTPEENPEDPTSLPGGNNFKNDYWTTKRKKSLWIALTLLFLTGGSYTIWKIGQQHGCMYWTGDQYIPVDCNEEPNTRRFLPLDAKKVKYFERITRTDTIKENSIGKIYYIKDNNAVEYYTYSGEYPNDLNRYVKKLSRRIFDKDSINRKRSK